MADVFSQSLILILVNSGSEKFDTINAIRLDDEKFRTTEKCCFVSPTLLSSKNCDTSKQQWKDKETYLYPNDKMPLENKYMCCADQTVTDGRDKSNIPGMGRCWPLNPQFAVLKMTPKSPLAIS